ncbi:sigma-70 factor domain-containing protein [Shigella flexneri]
MGTVELLTREGEIDIAKRIEDGINRVNAPLLNIRKRSPICWNSTIVLKQKKRVCPI